VIGIIFVVLMILTFYPYITTNKVELDSNNKLESVQPEVKPETVSVEVKPELYEIVSEDNLSADLETTREELQDSFAELKNFWFRPVFDGEEPVGIEIELIQDDSILGKLGVLKGDVIQSVNGIPMKNIADLLNAISSFDNGAKLGVEVSRGNYLFFITSGERLSLAKNENERFRVRPRFVDDYQAMGVEIWWIRDDCLLIKLGLQKNDIIKSINGKTIRNVGDLLDTILYESSKPRIDMEVLRNSEPLAVSYIVK
jgi:type II secretory pathway component PulC